MKQHGFWLAIRFDEAVILSASNATTGEHRTLDYVPGSAILGIAASRLYRTIEDDEKRYGLFHGGSVIFGNAYPVTNRGSTSIPSPLSIHMPKVKNRPDEAAPATYNLAFPSQDSTTGQLEQVRQQYITDNGESFKISGRQSLRTAINTQTGAAEEGQLFGYSSLARGTIFASWVGADELSTCELLKKSLNGAARLGRSRSAEFGQCSLFVLNNTREAFSTTTSEGIAVVYCLSDVSLDDDYGFPTRQPQSADFGLPDGELLWDRTHIRSRRYSPFNAALRTYETERYVIEKGSVLTFDCKAATVVGRERSVGQHQASGMGHIVVNPEFLMGTALGAVDMQTLDLAPLHSAGLKRPHQEIAASAQFHKLVKLRTSGSIPATEWANLFRRSLREMYATARKIAGASEQIGVGPSKSQWGRLGQLAAQAKNLQELQSLTHKNNIFKRTKEKAGQRIEEIDPAWGTIGEIDQTFTTFHEWFLRVMKGEDKMPPPRNMDSVRALIRLGQSISGERAHKPAGLGRDPT